MANDCTQDETLHNQIRQHFDCIVESVKFIAYENRSSGILASFTGEQYRDLEDKVDLLWVCLTEQDKETIKRLLMGIHYQVNNIRRRRTNPNGMVILRKSVHGLLTFVDRAIDTNQQDLIEYDNMVRTANSWSHIRYQPKPPPEPV